MKLKKRITKKGANNFLRRRKTTTKLWIFTNISNCLSFGFETLNSVWRKFLVSCQSTETHFQPNWIIICVTVNESANSNFILFLCDFENFQLLPRQLTFAVKVLCSLRSENRRKQLTLVLYERRIIHFGIFLNENKSTTIDSVLDLTSFSIEPLKKWARIDPNDLSCDRPIVCSFEFLFHSQTDYRLENWRNEVCVSFSGFHFNFLCQQRKNYDPPEKFCSQCDRALIKRRTDMWMAISEAQSAIK